MLGIDGMREWGPRQQWRVAGSRQLCLMFRSCFPRRRTASTAVGPTSHRPTAFVFSTFFIFLFFLVNYSVQDTHTHIHGWQLTSTTWLWNSPFLVGPTPTGASLPHSFVHARVKKSFLKKKKVKKKHKKWTISYTRHNSVIRGVIFIKRIVILQPTSLW